jgi:hypothetical protein
MIKRKDGTDIRVVHAALKSYRDSTGKTTKQHHYINEVRLIHYSLTGRSHGHVICLNRHLISKGVDYKLRKQVCRQVVENQKGKSST